MHRPQRAFPVQWWYTSICLSICLESRVFVVWRSFTGSSLLFDVNNYDKAKWSIGPKGVQQGGFWLDQLRQTTDHVPCYDQRGQQRRSSVAAASSRPSTPTRSRKCSATLSACFFVTMWLRTSCLPDPTSFLQASHQSDVPIYVFRCCADAR